MSSKAMSMKSKIRKYAKDNNIAAQVVLQNFMFECFLVRLFKSEYRDKFVVKGGMLLHHDGNLFQTFSLGGRGSKESYIF